MIHHLPAGDVTHMSRPGHRRTSCTTVDFQDQVQINSGTELAAAGIDLLVLRDLMGHTHVETTAADCTWRRR